MESVLKSKVSAKVILNMLFITLSLVLPQIFHLVGGNGNVFLPMHIPVLLAGFILGPTYGLLVGIVSPVISTFLTGMPVAFPMLPMMIVELGMYGLISGVLTKITKLPVIVSLILTMITGRLARAVSYLVIQSFFLPSISSEVATLQATITGIPGILIQLVVITVVMTMLKKRQENV